MTNAVNKMEEGPPLALYRRSQQIALRCCWSDPMVLSIKEKARWDESDTNRKDEAIEPPMKCRENELSVKTVIGLCSQDNRNGNLIYWLRGRRHLGGMISI